MLTTLPNRVSALLADPIQTVFRELNRDFSWSGDGSETLWRKFAPIAMWEDGNCFHIEMDVPGIILADIEVLVEKGRLTIRGERKAPEVSAARLHEERYFGKFERTVVLKQWVDPSTIEATLRDGVLHLKLAKRPESQRQTIAINHAGDADSKRFETFRYSLPASEPNATPLMSAA